MLSMYGPSILVLYPDHYKFRFDDEVCFVGVTINEFCIIPLPFLYRWHPCKIFYVIITYSLICLVFLAVHAQ